MKKKKVLFIITKSNFGGAQRYVYDLATNIPKQEYEVVVALGGTGTRGARPGVLYTKLSRSHVRIRTVHNFVRNMSLTRDIAVFFELWRIVRAEKPTVLHASSSKAGGVGVLVGRLSRIPRIVFTSHGLTFEETWRPTWQRQIIKVLTWITVTLSHATILVSHDSYKKICTMPLLKKKVVCIHNGIATPRMKQKREAREYLLSGKYLNETWIGSIAEYHPNKNLAILLDALVLLKQKGYYPHLMLIGEGEERSLLEKKAQQLGVQSHVHLLGFIPNATEYLKALDIFVLPSKKEGLPYVLMEAGLAKLPIVASDIPGNAEIITSGVSGILAHTSAHDFAKTLCSLHKDSARTEQYRTNIYQTIVRSFSLSGMVHATCAIYSPKPSIS